jgi:preprotein translocase subunit YajC
MLLIDAQFALAPGLLAAAAAPAAGPSMLIQLAPFVLIFVVFYFMLIRPQQQRIKAHRDMIANLRRGDVVVTGGGLIGKIVRVAETGDEATVELADNLRVKVLKSTITEVRAKTEPAKAEKAEKAEEEAPEPANDSKNE